jgi:hypothetical protein
VTIVRAVREYHEFFADELEHTMKGLGTKDRHLVRIMVMHSETDLRMIADAYFRKYKTALANRIHGDTGGNYRRLLLKLLDSSKEWCADFEARQRHLATQLLPMHHCISLHNPQFVQGLKDDLANHASYAFPPDISGQNAAAVYPTPGPTPQTAPMPLDPAHGKAQQGRSGRQPSQGRGQAAGVYPPPNSGAQPQAGGAGGAQAHAGVGAYPHAVGGPQAQAGGAGGAQPHAGGAQSGRKGPRKAEEHLQPHRVSLQTEENISL